MSWIKVPPYAGLRKEARQSSPVSVAITRAPGTPAAGTTSRLFFAVTVRPDVMPGGLPWWRVGQDVDVDAGEGEDAGRLRIACNGPYLLNRQGGSATAPTVLRFPLIAGVEPMAREARRVEYEVANGALMLTLPPDWFADRQQAA